MRDSSRFFGLFFALLLAACGGSDSPTAPGVGDTNDDPIDAAAIRPQLLGLASEVVAVDSAPNEEPWALTSSGTVLRRIEGRWEPIEFPADRQWSSRWEIMDVQPNGSVVFYDQSRELIVFDGSDWTVVEIDPGYFGSVEDMLALAEDELYFVQTREIWKWNGVELVDVTPTDPLETTRYRNITHYDGRFVVTGSNGTFAFSSGGTFQLVDIGTTETILDVWMDPSDDAWMVGSNGLLARYDFTGVDEVEFFDAPEDETFNLVTGTGRSLIYFGGEQIYRFDGVSFTPLGARRDGFHQTIWAGAGNDLAIGGNNQTMLEVFDGASWEPVWSQRAGYTQAIYGASDGTLILGDAGHLENGDWVAHTDFGPAWRTVEGVASDDLWGYRLDQTMWHWDGASWTEFPVPLSDTIVTGIWAGATDDVHAVGGEGRAMRWDGVSWTGVPTPTSIALSQLAGGPGGVFALGSGVLLELVDGTWVDIASPAQGDLYQLGNLGDVVFLRSDEEMLINRTGAWESYPLPAEFDNSIVVGSALDDVFGVRVRHHVHHFDGQTVTPIPTIEIDGRLGFESTGRGELVVTGFGGAVRYAAERLDVVR